MADLKLTLDASEIDNGLDTIIKQMRQLDQVTEATTKEMKSSFGQADKEVDSINKSLSATVKREKEVADNADKIEKDIKNVAKGFDQAEKSAKGLETATNNVSSSTSKMAKGVNGAFNQAKDGAKGLMSNISGGSLLAGAGVGALVTGAVALGNEVIKVDKHFDELRGTISKLTGETGSALDDATVKVEALSNTFGEDQQELVLAANTLSKEFGISVVEALELVEIGMLSNANAQGDLIDNVKEYSSQIAQAGGSAGEFLNILNDAGEQGIFSDKGIDVVKEFGLRIREQTDPTKEAIENAFGQDFANQVFGGIEDGTLSTIDAVKLVSKEIDNFEGDTSKLQTVIADVFGGAGEDAGIDYIKSLQNIKESTTDLIDESNELTQRQLTQIEVEEEYAEAQNELSKIIEGNTEVSQVFTKVKTVLINALIWLIGVVNDGIKWLQSMGVNMDDLARTALSLISPVTMIGNALYTAGKAMGFWGHETTLAESAMASMNDEQKKQLELQKESISVTRELIKASQDEISNANTLLDALKSENTTREEKKAIMKKLNAEYGDVLQNQLDEEGNLINIESAYQKVNEAILENSLKKIEAQMITERLNAIVQEQIRQQEVIINGAQSFGDVFAFTGANVNRAVESFENLDEIMANVRKGIPDVANKMTDINKAFDKSDEAVTNAKNAIKSLEAQLSNFAGSDEERQVLEAKLRAQYAILEKYDVIWNSELKKALETRENARKRYASNDAKANEKRLKDLKKFEDDYAKALKKLYEDQAKTEIELTEDKYTQIKQKENQQLQELEKARNEFAKTKILAESAKEGIILTDEELENRVNMYELSKEEALAFETFRIKVKQNANEQIKQLEIESARNRINQGVTGATTEFSIIETVEQNQISNIDPTSFDGSEADREAQVQAEILKIRKDSLDKKIALIDIELDYKLQGVDQEIALLKEAGEEENAIEIHNLELKKELYEAETEARKIELRKQVEDVQEQAQEIITSFEEIGNAIGTGLDVVFADFNLSGFDQMIGKLGQLTDASIEFSKELDDLSGEDKKKAIMDFASSTAQALAEVANSIVGMISEANQEAMEANQELIDSIRERRSEIKSELDQEIEDQRQGYANNVEAKRAELDAVIKEEQEALKEKEALAKKQKQIETTMQIISLISASAQVFSAFASIPIVGIPLAAVAIAGMFAAFFAFKAKANKAKAEKGMHGDSYGEIKGRRHYQGGENFTDHLEIEGGEKFSIYNRTASKKYGNQIADFTEMVNSGLLPQKDLDELLNGTGVVLNKDMPQEISIERENMKLSKNILINQGSQIQMDELTGQFKEFKNVFMKRTSKQFWTDSDGNNWRIEHDEKGITKRKIK